MTAPDRPREPARWPLTRRTFLQLAGISAAGLAASGKAMAQSPEPVATQAPSTTDPDPVTALAGQLEFDLERMFRFVADEVAYEPYAGVLRGAKGALRGRAANSADKAVLLASLLEVSQIPYRYVSGTLDDTTAAAVLSAALLDQVAARELAEHSLRFRSADQPSLFAPAPAPSASPPPDAEQTIAQIRASAAPLIEAAGQQLDSATAIIIDALAAAGITPGTAPDELPVPEREQHLWVQAGSGTEWIDLDPTLPGTQQGTPLGTMVGDPSASLPDALRHRIEFAVIAEFVNGGQLEQSEIHRQVAWADQIAGVPIVFFHARADDLQALGVGIIGAIEGSTQYYPVLVVGSDAQTGDVPLRLAGEGGLFDEPGSIEGEATAEWLELRISSPGSDQVRTRRTVFDRVGAEQRAIGAIDPAAIAPIELVEVEGLGAEYLPATTIHAMGVATGPMSADAFQAVTAEGQPDLSMIARCYHYLRDAINSELGLARGVRVMCDGPTVASFTLEPTPLESGSRILTSIDIFHRSLTTLPLPDVASTVNPGVVAGVLSHVAERMATGDGLSIRRRIPRPAVSVGLIFERARDAGIPTRVLTGPAVPSGSSYPPQVAALLASAFQQGLVAVIPESAVDIGGQARIGWWLVDPVTGRTTDQLDDGRGASLTEYATKLRLIAVRAGPAFAVMATCVASVASVISIIISAVGGGEAASMAADAAQAVAESGAGEGC